jgi:hypothetical protein
VVCFWWFLRDASSSSNPGTSEADAGIPAMEVQGQQPADVHDRGGGGIFLSLDGCFFFFFFPASAPAIMSCIDHGVLCHRPVASSVPAGMARMEEGKNTHTRMLPLCVMRVCACVFASPRCIVFDASLLYADKTGTLSPFPRGGAPRCPLGGRPCLPGDRRSRVLQVLHGHQAVDTGQAAWGKESSMGCAAGRSNRGGSCWIGSPCRLYVHGGGLV